MIPPHGKITAYKDLKLLKQNQVGGRARLQKRIPSMEA